MKITILGGGPAGLYCAILLKKGDPTHEISVIERNAPDSTYGWGVVFSDRTLASFREADYKTYTAITDHFVTWDAIDTCVGGELVRCGGHVFAGLARKRLLAILQERCRELGVTLHFKTDITDLAQLGLPLPVSVGPSPTAQTVPPTPHVANPGPIAPLAARGAGLGVRFPDLLIAADGVNSLVRSTYAEVFQPSLAPGKAKYIWLGTDKVLDAFTFIFRENEHGFFQVHSYPFDGTTSTFIVECAEEVWRRAGLDAASEAESISYCERLFASELRGAQLLPNNSKWISFITVKNATWRHGNVVLLGDCAHTAHFSIGSGTKLAMEDAIALANAIGQHADSATALREYEAERRPSVETLQEAARESQRYFEGVSRYRHLAPIQFTFNLLTRSGRVTYDDLRLRDVRFGDAVERCFGHCEQAQQDHATAVVAAPPLFTPIHVGGSVIPNRVVLMPTSSPSQAGVVSVDYQQELRRCALAGAGLVLTAPVAVHSSGRITPECAGMYRGKHIGAWQAAVRGISAPGGPKIGILLNHAGRRGATRSRREGLDRPLREGAWPLVSASALPYTPRSQTPTALDRAGMDRVRDDFVRAAQSAHTAGFDLLMLHMGHGYLLASFLSPLTNVRADEYGGSLENRLRFPLEVFDAVRAVWPAAKALAVALNCDDWVRGGFDVDDAITVAHMLKTHGCDLMQVLAGQTVPDADHPAYGRGFLTPLSDRVRNEAGVPTLAGGYLANTNDVNTMLAAGRADLCLVDFPRRNPIGIAVDIAELGAPVEKG